MTDQIHVCAVGLARVFRSLPAWAKALLASDVGKLTGVVPSAVTIDGVTFYFGEKTPAMERHEAVHAVQQQRMGWWFYLKYMWQFWRYGYDAMPLENEARAAE